MQGEVEMDRAKILQQLQDAGSAEEQLACMVNLKKLVWRRMQRIRQKLNEARQQTQQRLQMVAHCLTLSGS